MPHPSHNLFNTRKNLRNDNYDCVYYSLPTLSEACNVSIETLPVSIRILLESLLRNYDEHQITEKDIINLANWNPAESKICRNTVQTRTCRRTRFHRSSTCR